jgi:site-specific recombinase XerD
MGDGKRSMPSCGTSSRERSDQFITDWLDGLTAARTRAAYRGDLHRFITWLESRGVGSPLEATGRHIERFQRSLEAGAEAASTMARRMSALRSFYRFVASRGGITASPTISWRAGPEQGVRARLDDGEIAGLLAAAEELGGRTAAIVGLMMFNGMRLDEVLACDAGHVRIRQGTVRIALARRDGAPSVEVDRWTAAAVRGYLGDRRDGPLLLGESPTRAARRLTRFGADYLIKRAGSAAGIEPPMSANTLRRAFVAQARAGGMPLPEIRDRLGHRDVRTTMRHVTGDDA